MTNIPVTPAPAVTTVMDGMLDSVVRCVNGTALRIATAVILWIFKERDKND